MRTTLIISCLCLIPALASAQTSPTNTLEKIRQTRQISLGIRANALPFSTLTQGEPSGYSVDLCGKVVDNLRKELKIQDLKVRYVPVTAASRIPKLTAGDIDIVCGSTVNTRSRQAQVAFSYSTFFSGEKLLVRANSGIQDYTGLGGHTVAYVKGSTAEKMFTQIRDSQLPTMKLVPYKTTQEAFHAVETGAADAMAQTDVLIEGVRLASATPKAFVLTQQAMSVEPMALMVRKDDKKLLDLVDRTLASLYSSGEINTLYAHWFDSATFKMPMSIMLRDAIAHPHHEPAVALGLGYQL